MIHEAIIITSNSWIDMLTMTLCFPTDAKASIQSTKSDTESVKAFEEVEPEIVPFDLTRLSGSLNFWNNPKEDIYDLGDGQPI